MEAGLRMVSAAKQVYLFIITTYCVCTDEDFTKELCEGIRYIAALHVYLKKIDVCQDDEEGN